MLREVATIASRADLRGQASLETMMACGVGTCMGCPVEMKGDVASKGKYQLVCKDGPVFNLHEVKFDA